MLNKGSWSCLGRDEVYLSKKYSIFIFGLLVIACLTQAFASSPKARVAKAKSDLSSIYKALQMYNLENKVYPSSEQGLLALVVRPVNEPKAVNWQDGGYLSKYPLDPWQREYRYVFPSFRDTPVVYTFGEDGVIGGCGDSRDMATIEFESGCDSNINIIKNLLLVAMLFLNFRLVLFVVRRRHNNAV